MSDAPDLLERVRMCLAEVGEDASDVRDWGDGSFDFPHRVSDRMAWRAVQLAKVGTDAPVTCFVCGLDARWLQGDEWAAAVEPCAAFLPLTEDCGVSR